MSGEKSNHRDLRIAGEVASVAIGAYATRQALDIDSFWDFFAVTGMAMADGALAYFSFRDGIVGKLMRKGLKAGQSASNNRERNSTMAGVVLVTGTMFTVAGMSAANQEDDGGENAATNSTAPAEVTVITGPLSPPASSGGPYPCELEPFSPDGDGFPSSGSGSQITKLQKGINVLAPRLNIAQIEVTGDLVDNTESIQAITVFKDWAAIQLGDSFIAGREGQVTPQMCTMLDLWNDGDPNTP